jgi:hypothetical protein
MDSAAPPLPKRNKRKIPRQATSEVAWEFDPVVVSDSNPLLEFPPYLHKQPQRNSITPDLQRAFVAPPRREHRVREAAAQVSRAAARLGAATKISSAAAQISACFFWRLQSSSIEIARISLCLPTTCSTAKRYSLARPPCATITTPITRDLPLFRH